jgi:imidazoleglycerol phosphate synthase glutamine amidotransferase subunit HisH
MGWNNLVITPASLPSSAMSLTPSATKGGGLLAAQLATRHSPLVTGLSGRDVYFVHSYHFVPDEDVVVATVDYGGDVVAAVAKGNIFGTQFHPEKSQAAGLQLIQNFINWQA